MRFAWPRFWVFWVLAVLPVAFVFAALSLAAALEVGDRQREVDDLRSAWDAREPPSRVGPLLVQHSLAERVERERAAGVGRAALFGSLAALLLGSPALVWLWRRWRGASRVRRRRH